MYFQEIIKIHSFFKDLYQLLEFYVKYILSNLYILLSLFYKVQFVIIGTISTGNFGPGTLGANPGFDWNLEFVMKNYITRSS